MTVVVNPYVLFGELPPFSPLDLSPLVWYDPSDLSSLFQDSAMTTPVTADGDVVGAMMDKSGNGRHLLQATTANKPLYKTSGGLHWLLFDKVNDSQTAAVALPNNTDMMLANRRAAQSTLPIAAVFNVASNYLGAATDGAATSTTSGAGAPSYRINGTAVPGGTAATRDQLYDAWAPAAAKILEVEDAAVAVWPDTLTIGNILASFAGLERVYGFVARASFSEAEEVSLRDWLADKLGISLIFDPLALGPIAWYDPSDLTTLFQDAAMTVPVAADGDVVGAMKDKSGNGYHLLQATTANKPLYKTSGGLYWLQFDSANDYLSAANVPGTATWSMCAGALFNGIAGGSIDQIMALNTGIGLAAQHLQFRRSATATQVISINSASTAFTDTSSTISASTAYVLTGLRTAAAADALVNGASNGTTTITGTARTGTYTLYMGVTVPGTDPHDGRVFQAVYLGREFAGSEKADTEAYVATKSGVTL